MSATETPFSGHDSSSSPSRWRPGVTVLLALLAVTAIVQIAVPVGMIVNREATLDRGTIYRFKTEPVDPYDAFRGRYVQLGFTETTATIPKDLEIARRELVYVALGTDEDGFARLGAVSKRRPDGDYLRVRVRWVRGNNANVVLPFDRFYMAEHAAPQAETLYRRGGQSPAFVTVAVHRGRAVLEELYVDDMPVLERLELGEMQPLLGSWLNQAAHEAADGELTRLSFRLDGTAACVFGSYDLVTPLEQQEVQPAEVLYQLDQMATPQRLTLGPFDDGPYAGEFLVGVIEFDNVDQLNISWQSTDPDTDRETVAPSLLDPSRQSFHRTWN